MDKMIGIINHNLEAIINGIKGHKERAANALNVVENEIKAKLKIADKFKSQIKEAKEVIANLENEINDLEDDLKELNDKFGSKNFIEILSAGNKEINNKINEKKSQINEQNSNIVELEKKEEYTKSLVDELKNKKEIIIKTLTESSILEKYYCSKLQQIVNFADEHKTDLKNYVDEDKLNIDITDVEEEQLLEIVDDSVFKELDDYTSIISSANEIIEKSKEVEEKTHELNLELERVDEISTNEIENKIIPLEEKLNEEDEEENVVNAFNYIPQDEEEVHKEEPVEDNVIDLFIDEEGLKNQNINPENLYSFTTINIDGEEININDTKKEEDNEPESENNGEESIFKQVTDIVYDKEEILNSIPQDEIDLTELQNAFTASETPFSVELEQCNLSIELFDIEDRIKLQSNFNKQNTIDFIDVMKKHHININVIYRSVNTLIDVTPQNLDEILSLIEKTGVNTETIELVFASLNNINISKLEQSVKNTKDKQLTEILYECKKEDPEDVIAYITKLDADDAKKLKKSATEDEYKMMNLFPEIVLCNFNTIKSLGTNNLIECFTKHPHRFLYNPEAFNDILDKYDLEDLIRCINKNAAVIDKL